MSIKRITISVSDDVARRIKKAAGDASVSAWVTGVIEDRLDDAQLDRLWEDFYQSVSPRKADVRKADALFDGLINAPRRTKVA